MIVGVAAAAATQIDVLIAGIAGLVAGVMSMAAGEYVSVSWQSDTEQADLEARKMKGFIGDIEELTEANSDFRRVLYNGKNLQLALMEIEFGGEIGEEVHHDRNRFFRVEEGKGEVVIGV